MNSARSFLAVKTGSWLLRRKSYFWLMLPIIFLARYSKAYFDLGLRGYNYQFWNLVLLMLRKKSSELKLREYRLSLESLTQRDREDNETQFNLQLNQQTKKHYLKRKLLIFILPDWWKSYLTTEVFRKNVEYLSDEYSYEFKIVMADSFYQKSTTKILVETDGLELAKIINKESHDKVTLFFVGLKYFPNANTQEFLKQIRKKTNLTCVCYLPDIWQDSYFDVIRNHDQLFDEFWVYEIPEKIPDYLINKIKLVLFPRHLGFNSSSALSTFEGLENSFQYRFYFRGNFYFGRLIYLFFLTRLCRTDSKLLTIEGNFGQWSGSTDNYLKELLTTNLATLNFLERDPGNFTLTERVWDSFASRGLVIAHVGLEEDPISRFFEPNVEYLPFRNLSELYFIFRLVIARDEVLDKVRVNGYRKFKHLYSMGNLFELLE